MGNLESLRRQLEQIRDIRRSCVTERPKYCGAEDFILQHGKVYTYKPLTHSNLPGIPTQCFQNCYSAATRKNSPWIYVEGFALIPSVAIFPFEHAWLTRKDTPDAAYDPTWDHANKDVVYLGVPFLTEYIVKICKINRAVRRGYFGVLHADRAGYPLLTGADPLADVMWRS
jgi:hypothetical protein